MRNALAVLALTSPLLAACQASDDAQGDDGDALPQLTGSYAGSYEVPTDSAELAAAAIFDVEHIDWRVVGGVVTLDYDLPVGLVGGDVHVELSGALADGATAVELTGPAGTGTCTRAGSIITCQELFTGLPALPISDAVVEARAAAEYAGPLAHRLAIAELFSTDPIGIAIFDLDHPVVDDHGGGDDD